MKNFTDSYGRRIRKLRISLTDVCNLRCTYCMPEKTKFSNNTDQITCAETITIVDELMHFGLEEVRLTGGEPLVSQNFTQMVTSLGKIPLQKKGITTNAVYLAKYLDMIFDNGFHHLNISLDSLDPKTFEKVTLRNQLHLVLKNIEAAKAKGFQVKINTVLLKGINDHEVENFIKFSEDLGVTVRFLELMQIGFARNDFSKRFISAATIIKRLKPRFELSPIIMPQDSTSFNYKVGQNAQIGFIASESQPFCGNCSRWRLAADGKMYACLLKDHGVSIRGLDSEQRFNTYMQLLREKPLMRPHEVNHIMNTIGG